MKTEFREEQKFTQWWLWLLLISVAIPEVMALYRQFISGGAIRTGTLVSAILIFGVVLLFLVLRLRTHIDQNEIRVSYFPFLQKRIKWSEVENAAVIKYGFVGGWGFRFLTKYGTVYNVKGNRGIWLKLKNGKSFVIGTQKEEELKEMLEGASGDTVSPQTAIPYQRA